MPSKLPPPDCSGCHEKEAKDYADEHPRPEPHDGRFRRGQLLGLPRLARHSAGEGSGVAGFQAEPAANLRQVPQQPELTKEYQMKFPEAASQYMDSIHGRALLKMGLIVAPSCNDCHGVHDIKRARGPRFAHQPRQRRQDLRQMPRRHRGNLPSRAFTASCWPRATSAGRCARTATRAHRNRETDGKQFQGHQRRALRQMPRGPAGALPRHLPRQGHGARQAERRPGRRRLLRLPRLSRRAAAVQPGVASVENQHPRHLPAMSSGRHHRIHRIQAARQSAGREKLSAAPRRVSWP